MSPRQIRRSAGASRTWAAWLAVIALLTQALLPSAAMAAASAGVRTVELCAAGTGPDVVKVDRDGQPVAPFAGLPCLDCLTALTATIASPELRVEPVRRPVLVLHGAARAQRLAPPARAPPRPPGQGPPAIR